MLLSERTPDQDRREALDTPVILSAPWSRAAGFMPSWITGEYTGPCPDMTSRAIVTAAVPGDSEDHRRPESPRGPFVQRKEAFMFAVSETATEELRKTLDEVPPEVAYRLLMSDEGYKVRLDSPAESDRIIESEDRMVLMLAPDIDQELADVVLDVVDSGVEGKPVLKLLPAAERS